LADAHAALASCFISERAYDKAQEEIEIALSLDPDCYVGNKEAGRIAFMQNRHADAIRYYEKASVEENDFSTTGLLITSYTALGDKAGARSAAERTLKRVEAILALEPDNGSAMSMGIGALAYLGQGDRAKEMTKRALLLDPDNLNMRYNIACAFIMDLADAETGLDLLEPVIANFPKDRLAHAKIDPDFDGIREHPRFKAMMAAADARLASQT
jgi:adenylate cyclase